MLELMILVLTVFFFFFPVELRVFKRNFKTLASLVLVLGNRWAKIKIFFYDFTDNIRFVENIFSGGLSGTLGNP